jgi:hypothetical protein
MRKSIKLRRALAPLAALCTVLACSELATQNNLSDNFAPTVKLATATSSVDSVLMFTATVTDNLGIKRIHIDATGGVTASIDSVFTSAVTQTALSVSLSVPRSVPPGTAVLITGYAYDGAGNRSAIDTLRMAVGNLAPGTTVITSPASGTVVVQGKSVVISISGTSPLGITGLGTQTTGSFVAVDSTLLPNPLRDSTAILDTINIPPGAALGSLVVTPFLRDSLGQRILGTPITLTVQSPSASTNPPTVNFGTTSRVEVTDTMHVEATDPNGITYLGYEIRLAPTNGSTTPPAATVIDSMAFGGNVISVPKTFAMALPSSIFSQFPRTIYVRAFARNGVTPTSVRGYAKLPSGAIREDTLTVVAGVTRALPFGGTVADALYHTGLDRLFLTNIDRNTVEVFNLADSSFKTAINVGSRPWGITAWPQDHSGTMGDTLLVANSGGTDISYVNLNSSSEVFRYELPNLIAYTVTTVNSSTTGLPIKQRTKYDFSDRPQYLATTCRGSGSACGDVVLLYSTTPTPGQSQPFSQGSGTLRWENLTQTTVDRNKSHFFFEQAVGQTAGRADTLEIERWDASLNPTDPGYFLDLVPSSQAVNRPLSDTTPRFYSVVVQIPQLAFRDTTYVRNSGDFQHAVFGEGGPILNSRAMTYDAGLPLQFQAIDPDFAGDPRYTLTIPVVDQGISGAFNISDFIANTAQRVSGVAMNFDGALSAIRGDSTYFINHNLRLQGLIPTTASNSGLDFHPSNTGINSPLASRLIFTASADANLQVWDTYCYQLVATVPIRDPIIGPIKAALRQSTGKLILFGVTAKGIVIITLPNNFQTSCH